MRAEVKQGDYSFQSDRPKNRGRAIAALGVFLVFLSFMVSTQYFGMDFGRNRLPGGVNVAGIKLYAPWQILAWMITYRQKVGNIKPFYESLALLGVGCAMGLGMIGVGVRQMRQTKASGALDAVHGSAHWANREQIAAASLLPQKGQPGNGVYVGGWVDPKEGRQYYLRHAGKEHILVFAPTRSGKGVGLVLPTLLSWEHSVVNLDVKGENWALTSGWRKQQGHKVLRWDPTDAVVGRSVSYNPIEEIRIGTPHEIGDIMNVAGILVDPDGKGGDDHWTSTARSLLTGAIAHVAYRARKEGRSGNLADVLLELTKPGQGYNDTMQEWLSYEHAIEGDVFYDTQGNPSENLCHPIVVKAAQEMLNRAEAEASSVLSSAIKYLELYGDPVIARNSATSGFRLIDLMNHEQPVSLYLVLNPASIRRIRPLVRLFLTQMIYALMPEMEFRKGEQQAPYRHRLLLLFDEFPSIGRVGIISDAISYFAGWNIKAYLITQDLKQLYEAYGKDAPIIGNCHIQVAYAPNNLETAEYLSKQTGITTVTVVNESESYQGGRGLFTKKSISRQQQQLQRPLLTPDECMRLPGPEKDADLKIAKPGDMLIFAAGFPVVYGRQILYFLDPTFSERAKIDAPEKTDVLKVA